LVSGKVYLNRVELVSSRVMMSVKAKVINEVIVY
jgi:hypothetical protein